MGVHIRGPHSESIYPLKGEAGSCGHTGWQAEFRDQDISIDRIDYINQCWIKGSET